jgi:hypothetical protein
MGPDGPIQGPKGAPQPDPAESNAERREKGQTWLKFNEEQESVARISKFSRVRHLAP